MKVTEYDNFVRKTNQFANKRKDEQRAIALYGLIGEIGSVVAAVKKKLLAEGGETSWDQPNDEIKEELGDALWYCYVVAQAINGGTFDVLANDIQNLRCEIDSTNERARKIATALDPLTREAFLEAAKSFPPAGGFSFDEYQQLAFKTARTDGHVLLEVCLAVLWQLGAELLRPTLPEIEIALNRNVADRAANTVLGAKSPGICRRWPACTICRSMRWSRSIARRSASGRNVDSLRPYMTRTGTPRSSSPALSMWHSSASGHSGHGCISRAGRSATISPIMPTKMMATGFTMSSILPSSRISDGRRWCAA